jgi:hypothetical protein
MKTDAKATLDGRSVVLEVGPWSVELPIEAAEELKAKIEAALIAATLRRGAKVAR